MAPTLRKAACQANGGAATAHHTVAGVVGRLIRERSLGAGADLDSRPLVPRARVSLVDLDAVEIVGPEAQPALSRVLAREVMAGVLDGQPYVVLLGELQPGDNVVHAAHIDTVRNIVAQRARLGDWVKRVACAVLEPRLHELSRRLEAARGVAVVLACTSLHALLPRHAEMERPTYWTGEKFQLSFRKLHCAAL